jgi:hypothetical protein
MKAVARRILRLESALTPQVDVAACLQAWDWATILYQRRRRRAEANGLPFDQLPPERNNYVQQAGSPLTYAEVLRDARSRRTHGRQPI